MVELVLVIVIAGIIAAVAVPRLMRTTSFDTRGFADEFTATVRFAQKLAIAQRRPVFVRFTASDATLCYDAACASFAPGPGGETPYRVAAPGGVTIASPLSTLEFSRGGHAVLAAQLAIEIRGAGVYRVFVEQETGYVH